MENHPYQDQANKAFDIIRLYAKARKNGFWLEAIDLLYILLEFNLRFLLTSKADSKNGTFGRSKIDKQEYLMELANLAKDNYFIGKELYKKIKEFNRARSNAIHGLIQGRISYQELKNVCEQSSSLQGDIQRIWLPITVGEIETR